MTKTWNSKRRRFLQTAVATGLAAGTVACSTEKSRFRFLTLKEAETAAAICDRLIPPDEFPGAAAAGAVDYIDLQLDGHLRKYRQAYRTGLAGVNAASQAKYGTRFATLQEERRSELLKLIEAGKASGAWTGQREFFALILAHTMQSYYGDPRHGGNREEVGYRSIGLPAVPVRGRSQHDLTAPRNS